MSHNLLKHPYRPADASSETSLSVNNSGCVKCATNKVGKYSCCARGGAWFKNCGDVGDTEFDHSWTEGIKACKGFESSVLVRAPTENVGAFVYPVGIVQSRNTTRMQTKPLRPVTMFNLGPMDSGECVGFAKVVVCIDVLFIMSNLLTKFNPTN